MTIRGQIDGVKNNTVLGWAASVDERSGEYGLVMVEAVLDNGRSLGRVRADRFQAEVKQDDRGTGAHGFEIRLPSYLRSGGPFLVHVRAEAGGASFDLGQVVVLHGEAGDPAMQLGLHPQPDGDDLDAVLAYIRSVSLQVTLSHAEEVRAELGDAALVAYAFGRLLDRMPDRDAYESYAAALSMGVLDIKGFLAEILQSQEYRSRYGGLQPTGAAPTRL